MSAAFVLDSGGGQIPCAWPEFVQFWSDRYYEYSRVPDTIYWHVRNIVNGAGMPQQIANALALMGGWKTGSLTRNSANNLAYRCNCAWQNDYFYTNMWRQGTSAAFPIWTVALPARFPSDAHGIHTRALSVGVVAEQLAELTYHGARNPRTRFGLVYALTYLHFIADEEVPVILDRFAELAIAYLHDVCQTPALPYTRRFRIRSFQDYCDLLRPRVEGIFDSISRVHPAIPPAQVRRKIDRALWTFGHYINQSRPLPAVRSCCTP